VITPDAPCAINGIVTQRDGTYVNKDEGFVNQLPLQYDPRLAFAPNPKTVIRVAGGVFHDGTGGSTFQGGPAFRFDRVIRYTWQIADAPFFGLRLGDVSPRRDGCRSDRGGLCGLSRAAQKSHRTATHRSAHLLRSQDDERRHVVASARSRPRTAAARRG
jgi:hypothetical protein